MLELLRVSLTSFWGSCDPSWDPFQTPRWPSIVPTRPQYGPREPREGPKVALKSAEIVPRCPPSRTTPSAPRWLSRTVSDPKIALILPSPFQPSNPLTLQPSTLHPPHTAGGGVVCHTRTHTNIYDRLAGTDRLAPARTAPQLLSQCSPQRSDQCLIKAVTADTVRRVCVRVWVCVCACASVCICVCMCMYM